MRFYDSDLQSEHRAMQTRIATLEAENRGKDETLQKLLDRANDAEYLTRLGQLAEKHSRLAETSLKIGDALCDAGVPVIGCGGMSLVEGVQKVLAENALLRKALEAVRPSCRAPGCWCPEYLGYDPGRKHSAACDAAALACIPEAAKP